MMLRFLMILLTSITANTARADTQFTPHIFNFTRVFDACIETLSDNIYQTCQGALYRAYTLRREIGYALDECQDVTSDACAVTFTDAGLPAELLDPNTLGRCDMLGKLEAIELMEVPENACIEHIARRVERHDIPTDHNTDISCGIHYIECAEIIFKGTEYWETALWVQHYETLNAIPGADEFINHPETGHHLYSLLEQRIKLQMDLADVECSLETVIPHWGNVMDHSSCLGAAYAQMWQEQQGD